MTTTSASISNIDTTPITTVTSIPNINTSSVTMKQIRESEGISFYNNNTTAALNIIKKDTINAVIDNLVIKDVNDFKKIEELVPQKVYRFTFYDGTVIKTICAEGDYFDLEYAFYLALAKKLYSKTFTLPGILYKTQELIYTKYFRKLVKAGVKLFKKTQKEQEEKKKQEEIKKRQHEKYINKKIKQKERKKLEQKRLIAEAIRLSKEEE